MKRHLIPIVFVFALAAVTASAQDPALKSQVESVFPDARALYLDLHQHPELSSHETRTAALLAERLRALGYDVTDHVGGTGVVAILKNGPGPTVMLRTELDALPVEEKTGLPYASKVRTKNDAGVDVAVMHACGHDLHMSSLWAAAAILSRTKDTWHGTLILIAQPAEETISGARAMVADGLFTRFPKPDVGVAMHDTNALPVGQAGVAPEFALSNADSIRITVYGKGGHGAAPEATVDPIVIGASIVMRLQTIVSREVHPGDAAVITVGYFQAGTKNNIIPDQAVMALTVRSFKPEVRKHLLEAIERIAKGEAEAGGADKMPLIERYESTSAVYNDPVLARHLLPVLESALGMGNAKIQPPWPVSEDYSVYIEQGVPSFFFTLGVADPEKWTKAQAGGERLPSNHSPFFAPVLDPSLRAGIAAEVAVLRDLLRGTPADIAKITEHKSGE
ncbi:MAG TPA: amidohydrolase [Candidatus Acidoferrales bacterium]|nr:amidohydrolase [Candidatus Acidoferrales bacterium]